MKIIRPQQENELWHFGLVGLDGEGLERLAYFSVETESPEGWLAEHQASAQAALEAGQLTGPTLETLQAEAVTEVNRQANEAVMAAGILTNQLFFAANVSDIAFLITEWRAAGRPTELDPEIYYRAITEAQAYAETSDPTMTPIKMLQTWEVQWNWMRSGFADLNYHRRLALERIKAAESEADITLALAGLPWEEQ